MIEPGGGEEGLEGGRAPRARLRDGALDRLCQVARRDEGEGFGIEIARQCIDLIGIEDRIGPHDPALLIDELVKQDKYFELIAYPNRTHAIEDAFGENTRKHLYESMRRHFLRSIPPVDSATGAKL